MLIIIIIIIIIIVGTACVLHEILRIDSIEGKGKDEVYVNTMKAYGCGGLAPLSFNLGTGLR
jgi:hypothetical protein